MATFEAVTFIVTAVGLVFALFTFARTGSVLDGLGRSGLLWIGHEQDLPLADQPSEDGPDLPLPKRRLRGRTAA